MQEEKELLQIREYIIRILPDLLRKEPEIATTIEGILAQHFPRRDEFARLLDAFQSLREEMERRFALQREEIALLREEMNRRFEQMERHLGQVDRRLDMQHQEILELRRDVARLLQGHTMILEQMRGQEAWLRLVIGELRAEKGRALEDLFAEALRYGLENPNIRPESLRLRQSLVDAEGRVFKQGFKTEVDLLAEDDKLTVFEVKATAKPSDVDLFALKVELVAAQNPDKRVEGVLITIGAGEEIRQRCAQHGLVLVA